MTTRPRPPGYAYVSPSFHPEDAMAIRRSRELLAPMYRAMTGRHLTLSGLTVAAIDAGLWDANGSSPLDWGRVQLGLLVPFDALQRWTAYASEVGAPRALLTGHAARLHLDRVVQSLESGPGTSEHLRARAWLRSVRPARADF